MKTALIVLNYNDYHNTVKYVQDMECYGCIDQIIVVDNHSPNEGEMSELNKLISDKVDVIQTKKNGGYAFGNNEALRYLDAHKEKGTYDIVIISNPDICIDEITLSECIEYLITQDNVAICAPRMYFQNGPARRSAWRKRTILTDIANSTRLMQLLLYPYWKHGEYSSTEYEQEILPVDNIAGSFFLAKHDVFKEIGYFDENTFLFYEEDIIGDKIKEAGYQIHSLNTLKFIHYDSQTIGKMMNLFKKINILFDSKLYYQKAYHHANMIQLSIFKILRYMRKIELFFEIPLRKIRRR